MKKALILGSNGSLGQELVKVFSPKYEMTAWDKNDLDIAKEDLAREKIKELAPFIVINAAAYNAVDKCEEDEQELEIAKKINAKAPETLAMIANEIGAVFIHYSSDYVFGGSNQEGCEENAAQNPISKYGETKAEGERAIINQGELGLKYYLIRSSKLFGKKGTSKQAKDSFFDIMLKLGREKDELKIVDEEVSCFTYTPDLAQATLDLVEEKKEWGIYHIVNTTPCSWYGAALELFKIAKIDVKVIPVKAEDFPRPAKRPKYSVLINTKLKPLRSYKEALREYLGKQYLSYTKQNFPL